MSVWFFFVKLIYILEEPAVKIKLEEIPSNNYFIIIIILYYTKYKNSTIMLIGDYFVTFKKCTTTLN